MSSIIQPAPDAYHTQCGPAAVASALRTTPEIAASWLRRVGGTVDGRGTETWAIARALGTRKLFLARWHNRPIHDARAWPTVRQFLQVHDREDDDFVLRSREHVLHVRGGRIITDTSRGGALCRVLSVFPVRTAWPRCPVAEWDSVAVRMPPFTDWRRLAS